MRLAQPRPAGSRLIGAAVLAAALAVISVTGCSHPGDTGRAHASWSLDPSEPTLDRPTRATLTLLDEDDGPVAGARLQIEGHMNHPGMAPVVVPAEERRPGTYEAEIHFTMTGPWVLVASGTTKEGARLMHTLDVPGVAP